MSINKIWDTMSTEARSASLKQVEAEVQRLTRELLVKKETCKRLKLRLQAECTHEWADPIRGYEHEGSYCKHCHVNDMHLPRVISQWDMEKGFGCGRWGM